MQSPKPITDHEIIKAIQCINSNSAPGLDGTTNNLIKKCATTLLPYLNYLFNSILFTQVFPAAWKRALIIPFSKKSNVNNIDNYHPISLLPSLSKLFESIINVHLYHFLENNKLLSDTQFGFRWNNSTMANLIQFTNYINAIMSKTTDLHSIMIDFKKAFDSVSHIILLRKLADYNINQFYRGVINSYLSGHEQQTFCNNCISTATKITSGVPQGSILAPTLFIIYINNIAENITCNISLYADDVKLFASIRHMNSEEDIANFQSNINRIQNWSSVNK